MASLQMGRMSSIMIGHTSTGTGQRPSFQSNLQHLAQKLNQLRGKHFSKDEIKEHTKLASLSLWEERLEEMALVCISESIQNNCLKDAESQIEEMIENVDGAHKVINGAAEFTGELTRELNIAKDQQIVMNMERRTEDPEREDLIVAASANLRLNMCRDARGEPWDIFHTDSNELQIYGTGIQLYFNVIKLLLQAFGVASLFAIPFVVFNYAGGALDMIDRGERSGTPSGYLSRTTVGNLNVDSEDLKVGSMAVDVNSVTSFCGTLDALACALIFATAAWAEFKYIPFVVRSEKETIVTPDAFTIYTDRLPPVYRKAFKLCQNNYARALRTHFESILGAHVTQTSARRGDYVVHVAEAFGREDADEEVPHKLRLCRRKKYPHGQDERGRHVGKIVDISMQGIIVRWLADKKVRRSMVHNGQEEIPWDTETDTEGGFICKQLLYARVLSRMDEYDIEPFLGSDHEELDQTHHFEQTSPIHCVSLVRDLKGQLAELGKMAEKSKEVLHLDHSDVVGAFITFRFARDKDFVKEEYRLSSLASLTGWQDKRLRFLGKAIRVGNASTPSEVFWPNLDTTEKNRFLRRLGVGTACIVLVGAVIYVLAVSKQAGHMEYADCSAETATARNMTNPDCYCISIGYRAVYADSPPGVYEQCKGWLKATVRQTTMLLIASGVAAGVNILVGVVAYLFAVFERQKSVTDANYTEMLIAFIVKVLLLGIVTQMVYADWQWHLAGFKGFFGVLGGGEYKDFTKMWYAEVGSQIIQVFIFNIANPLYNVSAVVMFWLVKWWGTNRAKDWSAMRAVWTPPEFAFAYVHADMLSCVCATLIFSGAMPVLTISCYVRLWLTYWVDFYTLLRGSKVPPRYSHWLALSTVRWIQIAVFFHCVLAVTQLGNKAVVPSNDLGGGAGDVVEESLDDVEGDTEGGGALSTRILRSAAFANGVLAFLIACSFALRLFALIFGNAGMHKMVNSIGTCFAICCRSRHMVRHKTNQAAIFMEPFEGAPEKQMRKNQIQTSYDVSKHPGYGFLNLGNEGSDTLTTLVARGTTKEDSSWIGGRRKDRGSAMSQASFAPDEPPQEVIGRAKGRKEYADDTDQKAPPQKNIPAKAALPTATTKTKQNLDESHVRFADVEAPNFGANEILPTKASVEGIPKKAKKKPVIETEPPAEAIGATDSEIPVKPKKKKAAKSKAARKTSVTPPTITE